MTFLEALRAERGQPTKARRRYMKSNSMTNDQWYAKWSAGLAEEVAIAFRTVTQ